MAWPWRHPPICRFSRTGRGVGVAGHYRVQLAPACAGEPPPRQLETMRDPVQALTFSQGLLSETYLLIRMKAVCHESPISSTSGDDSVLR